jgi:hypothetical protein
VEFQKGLTSFNYQEIDSACSERQAQRSSTSCWSMASMVPRVTQEGKRRMRQAHVVAAVSQQLSYDFPVCSDTWC